MFVMLIHSQGFFLFYVNVILKRGSVFDLRNTMRKFLFFVCLFITQDALSAVVDTVSIYCDCMHKTSQCIVIIPDVYFTDSLQLPVLYLLHGYGGNHTSWNMVAPQLAQRADENHMIIVCPDGGSRSWYLDSPIDSTSKYETYFIGEVVPFIDGRYKTKSEKRFRAITGLSMGGHGALYLAIHHPDVFGAAGSTSGGVDIRQFTTSWELKEKVLGDTICCKQNWEKHAVINVVDQLKKNQLAIIIDCGISDFFLDVNRKLHEKLSSMKIPHDYTERPGEHNSLYWKNSIDYQILFFRKFFDSSTP